MHINYIIEVSKGTATKQNEAIMKADSSQTGDLFETASSQQPAPETQLAAINAGPLKAADASWLSLNTADMVEIFDRFLKHEISNGDATEDTIASYLREVRLWIHWCEEHRIEPARATRAHIVRYRDDLKRKGSAVSTRKVKVSIVRRFYDAAVQYGYLKKNPADGVFGGTDFTPPEERIVTLTTNALEALFGSIPKTTLNGKRDRAMVALMTLHGLRRIELHRLNEADLVEQGEVAFLNVQGKGHKMRQVHLRDDTLAAIHQYILAKREVGLPGDALFVSHDNRARGQRLSRRGLNLITDRYLEGSDLKRDGFSCRALRNTHGTLAIEGGASVETLRNAMGHNDIASTEVYVKAVERRRNNPSNFIDVKI
jgi:integrase/recombinase XerD